MHTGGWVWVIDTWRDDKDKKEGVGVDLRGQATVLEMWQRAKWARCEIRISPRIRVLALKREHMGQVCCSRFDFVRAN